MQRGYAQIPDWFSFENQGAGVAIADLSGTGNSDLIAFMVDAGAGQNRGVYRVGKNLDAAGNPTGGWTPWIEVPTGSRSRTKAPASRLRTSTTTASKIWSFS